MSAHKTDVVVIGLGAMGSSTAWWLARRGIDVVGFEQFARQHTRGSSHGGTRIFRFAYYDPFYVRMAQAALPLWRELEDDAGELLLDITGAVDHGNPASVQRVADALAECGAAFELLDPAAGDERWPAMRFEGRVLFHPDGGRCRADATVNALQHRATDHGASLHFETRARLHVRDDGVDVETDNGSWSARRAVVTAGAWVTDVLGDKAPPVTVTQEQVQHFTPVVEQEWPSFIHHRPKWIYGLMTPSEGVKVDEHFTGPHIHPDHRVARNDSHEAAMVRYVEEWMPGLDPTPHHRAECLYTTTPDENFVIERVGPVVIGSPCSGHGFKFTPYVGRQLADLAAGP